MNSANARFGLWDAWQAVLSALTWPNVGMRFEVSTLSGPDFTNAKTYKSFNHRQGAKNRKEEFFTRHARTPPKASDDLVELATQLAPLLGLPPPKANATRPPMANDGQTAVASRDGVDPREAAYAERSQRKRDAWWTPWSGARR